MAAGSHRYSCDSAERTMEWMAAIADFLRPFASLLDAHVVNFFKDRLWETVDEQWMECLRRGPVEDLLGIPYGFLREHWPASLQEFIKTLRSLVLPRDPKSPHVVSVWRIWSNLLQNVLCSSVGLKMFHDFQVTQLGNVLSQGMNQKKKHEVEILSAVVNAVANVVGADGIIDVGAGQGYLAQVLCFHYHLSVIALDASAHHATVISSRAERIKKHFAAKLRKSLNMNENMHVPVPRTVTCHILSSSELTAVIESIVESSLCKDQYAELSFILTGLHACGDLSVNMLRSFVECEQVKALVCIGCCYNLLSAEHFGSSGFPMSNGAKILNLVLGRNACDLGCQSEERWRSLTADAILRNFELHAFRAALQLVLDKYFSAELAPIPSIGRQGKALRRRQLQRDVKSWLSTGENNSESCKIAGCHGKVHLLTSESPEVQSVNEDEKDMIEQAAERSRNASDSKDLCCGIKREEFDRRSHNVALFKEFSKTGLDRLGVKDVEHIDLLGVWEKIEPFIDLVGPYWSLRAALGPLVESYILLDRLLFLQEQGSKVKVDLLPLFDPSMSPRNMAIIAKKC